MLDLFFALHFEKLLGRPLKQMDCVACQERTYSSLYLLSSQQHFSVLPRYLILQQDERLD